MHRSGNLGYLSALSCALIFTACNGVTSFTSPSVSPSNLASGMTWHGPDVLDLGAFGSSWSSCYNQFPASGSASPGPYCYNSIPTAYKSVPAMLAQYGYVDYQLAQSPSSNAAVMVGSFFTRNGNTRTISRAYVPSSAGGSGWAQPGPLFELLDDGSQLMTDVALSYGPNGNLLTALYSAFDPVAAPGPFTQTAMYTNASDWMNFSKNSQFMPGLAGTSLGLGFILSDLVDQDPTNAAVTRIMPQNPIQISSGATKSLAWDNTGTAYLAMNVPYSPACLGTLGTPYACDQLYVSRYNPQSGWAVGSPIRVTQNANFISSVYKPAIAAPQVQLLNDGLGVTAVYLDAMDVNVVMKNPVTGAIGPTGAQLMAAWSLDPGQPFANPQPLSTNLGSCSPAPCNSVSNVYNFAAAADQSGNVVVVFTQDLLPVPNIPKPPQIPDTVPPTRGAMVRLYASVRSATGQWIGPTQIDTNFAHQLITSTLYQDSVGTLGASPISVVGGIEFATPGIAYIGNGRFLATWAEIDNVAHTSGLYVRGYTVGSGWDPDSQIVTLEAPAYLGRRTGTVPAEAYRIVNDMQLVSDGQGDALLMLNYVVPSNDGLTVNDLNYGIKVYRYLAGSGWDQGFILPESLCQSTTSFFPSGTFIGALPPGGFGGASYYCWYIKPKGVIFPGGETVVTYPSVFDGNGSAGAPAQFRLYSMELRP